MFCHAFHPSAPNRLAGLFDVNTFEPHRIAAHPLQALTLATRTENRFSFRMKDGFTIETFHLRFYTSKVQGGMFGRCAFGKMIPIKPNRLLTLVRKLADQQIDVEDSPGACMFQYYLKKVAGERKFVHRSYLTPFLASNQDVKVTRTADFLLYCSSPGL